MRASLLGPMVVVVTIGLVAGARAARAGERVRARLTFAPDPDVERCPSARELQDAVASRIGYDPFEGPPEGGEAREAREVREVVVAVHRRGAGIVGVLDLRGPRPGHRELPSPRGDCREVLDAFAVAIAINLDPSSLTRPPGEPAPPLPPPPPPAPAPAAPVAAAPPPGADARPAPAAGAEGARVRLGGGGVVLFGELPSVAPGLVATFGVRWRWLAANLEGLATWPGEQTAPATAGRVTASLLALAFVPCGHADYLFACVGMTVGSLRGEGEGVAPALTASELYASASVRLGAEVPVGRSGWLGGYVDAAAPLTRVTLQLAGQDVWRSPSVAARMGATGGIRF